MLKYFGWGGYGPKKNGKVKKGFSEQGKGAGFFLGEN